MFKISKFGLKNFRIFKDYNEFDLAPITVLTGPNNSGKSSLLKALLLLYNNEGAINAELPSYEKLKYFGGSYNLGNHRLTINTLNENTIFSFGFLGEYKFILEVDNTGKLLHDYRVVDDKHELLISDGSGFKINFKKFTEYLRLLYNEYYCEPRDDDNEFINNNSTKEIIGENKLKLLISKLEANNYSDTVDELDIFEISDLGEDTIDLEWYKSLIFVLNSAVNIELTKDEVLSIVPFAESDFLKFENIILIPTLREQYQRLYTENDQGLIKSVIQERLFGDDFASSGNTIHRIHAQQHIKDSEVFSMRAFIEKYLMFIEKWIYEFGIGKELSYGYGEESDAYHIKIDGKSLLEYGSGYGQIIYLLLALANEIKSEKKTRQEKPKVTFPTTYIMEEPETSLHPSFQSKLAEMIVDAQQTFNVNFILETHSEYLIRKFQYLTANKTINPGHVVISYFHQPNNVPKNEKQIKRITIDKDGGLTDSFGPGFIDEATNLKFDLIRLHRNNKN